MNIFSLFQGLLNTVATGLSAVLAPLTATTNAVNAVATTASSLVSDPSTNVSNLLASPLGGPLPQAEPLAALPIEAPPAPQAALQRLGFPNSNAIATPDPEEKRTQRGDDFSTVLRGDSGEDALLSSGRFSQLAAGDGDDYLAGSGGNDWLYGEGGDDALFGGSGIDYLYGGEGDDLLDGGSGDDWMTGGSGADWFVLGTSRGNNFIWDFEAGIDRFALTDGLRFEEIEAIPFSFGGETLLRVAATQDILAAVTGIDSSAIGAANFVTL